MIENLVSFIIPNRGGKDLDKVIQNINEVYSDMNKEIIIVEQCDNIPFMRGHRRSTLHHCAGGGRQPRSPVQALPVAHGSRRRCL